MRTRILCAVVVGILVSAVFALRPRAQIHVAHYEQVMGTSLELKVLARTIGAAERAERAVIDEIARESAILSAYDSTSEFSRWAATSGAALPVSRELLDVLGLFDQWRARTRGALDPAAETVTRVWKTASDSGRLPTETELSDAVRLVRQQHWRIDVAARTAAHTSRAPLALNSFTKIYVVQRAAEKALAESGVDGVLVNVGGDLVVRGDWTQTVGIVNPEASADNGAPIDSIAVRDRAVATSGGYRRGFDIAGRHYSHVVDPRTGWPTGHVLSATVVASDAVDAGALATSLCVLKPEEGASLARSVRGVEFMMVLEDGRRIESSGWPRLTVERADRPRRIPAGTVYAAEQSPWTQGFELEIALELNRANAFGRRPYVAVWVEDKDHFPVRTIAVWYDKYRYLPELKAWYRSDRLRAVTEGRELIDSVSSATRAAGRYTLKWDGKDNQGKLVSPGTYTVFIEATREHGTYQVLRQELEFSEAPKHVDFPGGTEISGASLDYHKSSGR